MSKPIVSLRTLDAGDKENLFQARNREINRSVSLSQRAIDRGEHDLWYERLLLSDELFAVALEFYGQTIYFFTLSLKSEVARLGAIRVVDSLPHPGLGALLPLVALHVGFSVRGVSALQTETLKANAPVIRVRRLLGLDSIGRIAIDDQIVSHFMTKKEFEIAKDDLWKLAQDFFGPIAAELRRGLITATQDS